MKVAYSIIFAFACGYAANVFSDVVINEIHYDPPVKTELAEFIELYNTGSVAVDLGGWKLSQAVGFTFPAGTMIPAGGFVVIAENPGAFARKFPGRSALGPWSGLLSNRGEIVELQDGSGRTVDRVDYQLGFPWPLVGDPPGYSIELINPAFDNSLGGSWRPSVKGSVVSPKVVLVQAGSVWKYQKGTSEASNPASAWRALGYNDSAWPSGATPVGYDPSVAMGTTLSDMRGNYTSVFLRRSFNVEDPSAFGSLNLEALYDDGFKVWINGQSVLDANLPSREVAFHETASGSARESANYDSFAIASPSVVLRAGENVIAVQLHNISINNSSDCFIDVRLVGDLGSANAGPTPGARNAVAATNMPPALRQVAHGPEQPKPGETVRITAKITDADGVASAELQYQLVDPGSYIELNDAAYETTWTSVPMKDDGQAGDERAGDDIFTATLPASLQVNRRLVRYRIVARDGQGLAVRAPYLEDTQPNFAYFVYGGVPGWQGAARPGSTAVESFAPGEMGRLPAYHLIAKKSSVEDSTWNSKYSGDLYRWWGTLVYDGRVYDHIRYRARGGVWRYAMGKNMWKFDFNRGHDFQARDNFGNRYATTWKKLNLGANIQQGDYNHRGEQGMFESVGFRLFNLAGVESPKTHWASFRVIDEAAESGASQYTGDFWGLYLGIEQEDGRFLDEHGLPDGNLYKMEGYNGELNNQGRTAATDKSDLNAFTSGFRNSTPTEQWWRSNFDVDKYYSYQAIVQGIHHYDICYGKNYFYYRNPETGIWSVHTWDLDLTWADNMYDAGCGAADEFKNRVTNRAPFNTEYKNRVRELRDLLFNSDQAWKVIDEHAMIVRGTNAGPNILAADRAMWDYHPVMANSSIVHSSKAGQGRFYQFPLESNGNPSLRGSFEAGVQIMKNYVNTRGAVLDGLAVDAGIPNRPTISYNGPTSYPVNRLEFQSSSYSGSAGFAAMEWRVGEVRNPAPGVRAIYEIEPLWESGELTAFNAKIQVPPDALKVGHTYRARVRMKDNAGRWSNWSAPVQFQAGDVDNAAALVQNLRITEVMYNPPAGNDYEYVEIQNASLTMALPLSGATFTDGIDYTFPTGATLAPGEFALVIRGSAAAFRAHYGLSETVQVFGPYSGALNNDGETLTLKTAAAGTEIFSFTYKDRGEWPIAADGTGHSLVVASVGNLNFGGHWRASAGLRGSPGLADPLPGGGPVINEIAAHTDYVEATRPEYDSNDWIELYNPGGQVSTRDYYLSDAAGDLKKWRLPEGTVAPGGRVSYDEVTGFHAPITTGFGLNKAGEELFLSYLPGTSADRVVDAVRFKGQANGVTWGRYPDGGAYWMTLLPTRDEANVPAPPSLVISEIMYHPGSSNVVEESWLEYVEIYNASSGAASFSNTNGVYRLDGGIAFDFPAGLTLAANSSLLVVNFDPSVAVEKNRFLQYYSLLSSNVVLVGPFTGRLGNSTDRVALEKPEAPDLPGEAVVWVIVDEVIYSDEAGADGDGLSLTRVNFQGSGNEAVNLRAALPTPGWVIRQIMSAPVLSARRQDGTLLLTLHAESGVTYQLQRRESVEPGAWTVVREVAGAGGVLEIAEPISTRAGYYRVMVIQ